MAEKLDPEETVSFEELLMSNVYTQEALINMLEVKGILKKSDCCKRLRTCGKKKINEMGKSEFDLAGTVR